MKTKFIILLFFFFLPSLFSLNAQDSSYTRQSIRLELGLGIGFAGEGGGLSGRLGLSFLSSNWGGVIRLTAHDGENGYRDWFGTPKEEFFDGAILLSYVLWQNDFFQMIGSTGIGIIDGEMLSPSRYELEDFDKVVGFAYEFGIASAGITFGYSLTIVGNINSVRNLTAVIASVTLGSQK